MDGCIDAAGKLGGGQQLDQNGRVMRKENDRVIDRPYAETKEIVGGYITVKLIPSKKRSNS